MTVMVAGSTPSPIQPSSKAPPIFPAPTRTMLTARLGEPDEFDMEDLTTVPIGNSTSLALYASPEVSNMIESSASRGFLPAHTMN